jgi:hypothetical protein
MSSRDIQVKNTSFGLRDGPVAPGGNIAYAVYGCKDHGLRCAAHKAHLQQPHGTMRA